MTQAEKVKRLLEGAPLTSQKLANMLGITNKNAHMQLWYWCHVKKLLKKTGDKDGRFSIYIVRGNFFFDFERGKIIWQADGTQDT